MAEDVTFDLNCAYCGGPVVLQMADWPAALRFDGSPTNPDDIHHTLARWPCPYCQKENTTGLPARVAWVTKRVEDSESKH